MLAYLIGTSILNVFLGYALAVYLMRESMAAENLHAIKRPERDESAGSRGASTIHSYSSSSPEGQPPTEVPTRDSSNASGTREGAATASDDAVQSEEGLDRGPEQLDQQLLAGIADFRSQLAKLRAQTDTDEQPRRRPAGRPSAK